MMTKNRIDKILLDLALAESRAAAQKMILKSAVFVKERGEWRPVTKASEKFEPHCEFKVEPIDELRYASRAGLKLAAALAWLSTNDIRGQFTYFPQFCFYLNLRPLKKSGPSLINK